MKFLAFTDTHENKKSITKIIEKAENVDFLVCAGDISNLGLDLEKILSLFRNLNKKLLVVPGNHESVEQINKMCKKFDFLINIHLNKFIIEDLVFFGYGTGGFSKEDYELDTALKKIKFDKEKIIFVTHGPPYGTKLDFLEYSGHRGSKTVTEFIKRFKPLYCICGHLHENEGKEDKLDNTIIVNPEKMEKLLRYENIICL